MNQIFEDYIEHIPASEEPLSSDVFIIRGERYNWVYDTGRCDEAFERLAAVPDKRIILSHFHPDHTLNVKRLDYDALYIGKNTFKYLKRGAILEEACEFEDGVRLKIMPMPSSHAKGTLVLLLNGKYLFSGDGFYPELKGKELRYNVTILKEQIDFLKSADAKFVCLSHRDRPVLPKRVVIKLLEGIYELRQKDEPYVYVKDALGTTV